MTALANVAAAKIENVRLLEESLEKRRLEEDMRVAAEIQRGLLPSGAPAVPGYDLVGLQPPLPHGGRRLLRLHPRAGPAAAGPRRRVRKGHRRRPAHDRAARGRARPLGGASRWRRRWGASTARSARTSPTASTSPSSWPASIPAQRTRRLRERRPQPAAADPRGRRASRRSTEGGMVLGLFESVPYAEGVGRAAARATPSSSSRTASPRPGTPRARSSGRSASRRWRCAAAASTPPASRPRSCASWTASRPAPRPPTTAP